MRQEVVSRQSRSRNESHYIREYGWACLVSKKVAISTVQSFAMDISLGAPDRRRSIVLLEFLCNSS